MLTQVTAQQGTRIVITSANTEAGPFDSRLYVNRGATATLVAATHKTLKGATAWARKAVAQ